MWRRIRKGETPGAGTPVCLLGLVYSNPQRLGPWTWLRRRWRGLALVQNFHGHWLEDEDRLVVWEEV